MNQSDAFRDAIAAAGLTPPDEIIGDGKLYRFSSNGRPKDKAGWYVFHDDERPAGRFGCNRAGVDATWSSKSSREFTPEEKAAWKKKMQDAAAQRDIERQREADNATRQAAEMWNRAKPGEHPYLARKSIPCRGARVLDELLLVPVYQSASELVGLQRIYPDGEKRFLKGTAISGGYTSIGKLTPVVVIVEGFATAASVFMATGHLTVVAFNAGNLLPVAKKMRGKFPDATIIIGADDDTWTDGNPGITAATEAARAIGGMIAFPRWYGDRAEGRTDFNDLHADEGLEAVAECFHLAEDPEPTQGKNREAAPAKQPSGVTLHPATKPVSGGGAPKPENTGSDVSGFFPLPEGVAVQEPGPVMVQEPGSDVGQLGPLVDYYGWLPNVNDKGKPLSTIENVREICDRLGVIIRYNVISKDEEILIPGAGFSLDNKANASLAWLISECAKFRMPVDRVPDFATYLADCNQYNPVAEWVESKPWDGQPRLAQLCNTVTAVGQDKDPRIEKMKNAFIRRWMISAIAGAFRPTGVSAHGVLVFQGDQYLGKTKWFKTLVPSHLGVLQDGMTLRPDDRDSVKQVVSHWLVELGELDATFRKSDIAALKAFITRDRDVFRRAFARKESEYARRTVFFASVNPREFLHDPTGNRRYWTIECAAIDHSHSIDMQQCWAEVYELYKAGESWFLDADEAMVLTDNNKKFEVVDPIEEMINGGLMWSDPPAAWRWKSATDVLRELGKREPTQSEATKASLIIRERNGKQSKRTGSTRLLLVPECFKPSHASW